MGRNNGILLPGQGMPAPVGQMMISSPFNDIQLVAFLAAEVHGHAGCHTVESAVEKAIELVAMSIVKMEGGIGLQNAIRRIKEQPLAG